VSPLALLALVFFGSLFVGSAYEVATAGFSPVHVLGLLGLLGVLGTVKRIRDGRRDTRAE
jgi:uncharacterized membrane protein